MKKILFLLILIMSALLVGCGAKTQTPSASPEASTADTVTDDAGRKLSFAKKPSRIVSLTYGTDEILTEVVDTKRIQAYSRWAGDNEISFITKEQAQKVGCKVHDSLENILKLEPDLVVACRTSRLSCGGVRLERDSEQAILNMNGSKC